MANAARPVAQRTWHRLGRAGVTLAELAQGRIFGSRATALEWWLGWAVSYVRLRPLSLGRCVSAGSVGAATGCHKVRALE